MNVLKIGLATLAVACLIVSPALSAGVPAYPLKPSANGRYLVDQNGAPYLMMGDSPQALIVNLSEADAELFFADRAAHGFNAVWINLLCDTYTGGRADGSTLDRTRPFTGTIPATSSYDLSKTNEAYFAHVDRVVSLAAQHGLLVLLDPIETGGWLTTMADNGTNKCRAYGQFLGNRYKNFDNIIWMSGNDFQDWRNANNDAVARAVALGIKDYDTRHLHTSELDYFVSSSLDDGTWAPILGLNATYTYYPTYAQLLKDYNRTNFLPNFMVEANYEFEHDWTGNATLRRQEYWTMLSGAAGQLYGNGYTWPFLSGWQAHLDTPGAIQVGYVNNLFAARAWYDLIPDTNHIVVTAGYGTFTNTGSVNNNDYATAACTADGTLVMAYLPTARTLTVDMSKLSASATGHWYDPSSGSYIPIAGSPFSNSATRNFTPPGSNSDGDGDWILVLETNPPPIPVQPAFIQQNYATPQAPQTQVALAYRNAQTSGNANIVAIGWNDTTASISAVSDSAGNVYQAAVPTYRGSSLSQAIYYATNIKAGNNTITVMFDQPAAYIDLRATEYSGLNQTNAFDAGSSAAGYGTMASSGPVTTTTTNELLFGAGITASAFTAPGAGFAQRVITSPDGDIVEEEVAVAPGAYSATATLNSGAWLLQVAAFRAISPNIKEPALRIFLTATNTTVIAWPLASASFTLQQNSNIGTMNWAGVTNKVTAVGSENQVVISPSGGNQFYRLNHP